MTETNQVRPKIILFGASLIQWSFREETNGFGWALQQKYAGKAEVVNEGRAGYTTETLKPDFTRVLQTMTSATAPPTLFLVILVGANDACFSASHGEYVPLPQYESNIRAWIDSILIADALAGTKILLVTPPPINISDPLYPDKVDVEASKKERGYRTYMNKKRYADKVMEIAASYEETGLVVGVDIWRALAEEALRAQGRWGDEDMWDEERLPGCGLPLAKSFGKGFFTDGLHFGRLGYEVVTREVNRALETKWPEVLPEAL